MRRRKKSRGKQYAASKQPFRVCVCVCSPLLAILLKLGFKLRGRRAREKETGQNAERKSAIDWQRHLRLPGGGRSPVGPLNSRASS